MNKERMTGLENTITSGYGNIAGIVVQKDGETVYEHYFNAYTAENKVHVASVTKSVISALIGIAIDRGQIKSVDQRVLDFFPEYTIPGGDTTTQNITLRNLLTMTAPYKYESEPYEAFFASDHWVRDALGFLGGDGRIGDFRYAAIVGPDILSGILMKATGQSVLDYAAENLFAPLGMSAQQNVVLHSKEEHIAFFQDRNAGGWVTDPHGVNAAGWGLFLTPLDMAKIGSLYLVGGCWQGGQILSPTWVEESTKPHSRWEEAGLSYGYLWWIIDEKEQAYAAMGDGGNVIYVNTQRNLVISIASLPMPDARDRIELIRTSIEPAFAD